MIDDRHNRPGEEPRISGDIVGEIYGIRLFGPGAPALGTPEHEHAVAEVARRAQAKRRARGLPPPRKRTPECPVCDDVGFLDHPDGAYPCECRKREWREVREENNMPDADSSFILASYAPDRHPSAASALSAAEEVVERWFERREVVGGGLYVWGGTGLGKSHLAVGLARALMYRHGVRARIVNVPETLDEMRGCIGKPNRDMEEYVKSAQGADVLVMDDLGAQQGSEWERTKLYRILDHRLRAHLLTIVTSNVAMDDLESVLGERIVSRLHGMHLRVVHVEGEDQRRRAVGEGG